MASSEKNGAAAAAAAEQLGSMSLGEKSVERKDNETEPTATAKSGTTPPTKMCSACGKKSNTLKNCTACKCVWYCDKKCQNKHWKEHKKECKRIKKVLDERGGKLDLGEELDVGPLGKLPPREECSICMHALPLHRMLRTYFSCCGKTICGCCDYQHQMQSEKRAAEKGQTSVLPTCAFCRTAAPESDGEILEQLRKRVELKDPNAMRNVALKYGDGDLGLPVDHAKCIALLREAADLGCPAAQYQLGVFYHNGKMDLQQNSDEAIKYTEKAAEGGDLDALHNLGCEVYDSGDLAAAMRHWRLSASGGYRGSMTNLIAFFENGFLHHADLAETLQAMYRSRAEMKSEDRDRYIKHLKETGEYDVSMEL